VHSRSRFSLPHTPTFFAPFWTVIVFVAASASPCFTPPPQTPSHQEQRPRRANQGQDDRAIRLSTDLVSVITSVSDAAGEPVNDLSQEEFELFEDNVLQNISGFYREGEIPLRLVFLFDMSGSIRHRFDFQQRAAAHFFRRVMRPADQAAIISVSTDSKLELPFTSDVDKLVDSLGRLRPGGATALYNSMIEAAKYLGSTPGRHVIMMLSDGSDTASATTLGQAIAEIQRADCVVYAIHSTGVPPSVSAQDLAGEFALKTASDDTGGKAFFPPVFEDQRKESQHLDKLYERITSDIRSQYILTYYARSESRDGLFKAIRVNVRRHGIVVRARRGYYPAKQG
jgi:Ca-activated chloride channel family protein